MEYILIPSKSKRETTFLLSLLKKMQKKASALSEDQLEDAAFISALKEAEKSTMGSLIKTKAHLSKIASENEN